MNARQDKAVLSPVAIPFSQFKVDDASPVTAPETILLIGLGLFMTWAIRRRWWARLM
jgi:hypothetical protein